VTRAGAAHVDADLHAPVHRNDRDLVLDLDRHEPVAGSRGDLDALHFANDRAVRHDPRPAGLRQKDAIFSEFDLL
jgi:hypothetical protein